MGTFGTFRYLSYLGHFWTIWAILDHFGPFLNKSRKTDWPPPPFEKVFLKILHFLKWWLPLAGSDVDDLGVAYFFTMIISPSTIDVAAIEAASDQNVPPNSCASVTMPTWKGRPTVCWHPALIWRWVCHVYHVLPDNARPASISVIRAGINVDKTVFGNGDGTASWNIRNIFRQPRSSFPLKTVRGQKIWSGLGLLYSPDPEATSSNNIHSYVLECNNRGLSSFSRQRSHPVLIPAVIVRIPHHAGVKVFTICTTTTISHPRCCSSGHEKSMANGFFWKRGSRASLYFRINFCWCKIATVNTSSGY